MKIKHVVFLLVVFAFVLSSFGCASPQAPEPTPTVGVHPGKELTETRCSTCHGLAIVESSKKDRSGWTSTVDRMIMAGAMLDDEQKVHVVDYLAINFAKE
jgi:hypothetical protein